MAVTSTLPPLPGPVPQSRPLPKLTATIVVTALFGLFGLIPAAIHASRAQSAGRSGRRYWQAFGITLVVSAVVWTLVGVVAVVGLRSGPDDTGKAPAAAPRGHHAPKAAPAPTPDAFGLYRCADIWRKGGVLPENYTQCRDKGETRDGMPHTCEGGKRLWIVYDAGWGFEGEAVHLDQKATHFPALELEDRLVERFGC